jgi:hypothetical protein
MPLPHPLSSGSAPSSGVRPGTWLRPGRLRAGGAAWSSPASLLAGVSGVPSVGRAWLAGVLDCGRVVAGAG